MKKGVSFTEKQLSDMGLTLDSDGNYSKSTQSVKGINKSLAKQAPIPKNNKNTDAGVKKSSWKQGWRTIGGIKKYYRSKWEANYAYYLEFLKNNGEIIKWEHEPETFWFEGVKRGVMSYLPDFRIRKKDSSLEYHEVKGWLDPRSKTKIKRMKKYHPHITIILIDQEWFKNNNKQMKSIIQGWE